MITIGICYKNLKEWLTLENNQTNNEKFMDELKQSTDEVIGQFFSVYIQDGNYELSFLHCDIIPVDNFKLLCTFRISNLRNNEVKEVEAFMGYISELEQKNSKFIIDENAKKSLEHYISLMELNKRSRY